MKEKQQSKRCTQKRSCSFWDAQETTSFPVCVCVGVENKGTRCSRQKRTCSAFDWAVLSFEYELLFVTTPACQMTPVLPTPRVAILPVEANVSIYLCENVADDQSTTVTKRLCLGRKVSTTYVDNDPL